MNVWTRWVGLVSFGLCAACWGATSHGNGSDDGGAGDSGDDDPPPVGAGGTWNGSGGGGSPGSGGFTTGGAPASGGAFTGGTTAVGGRTGTGGTTTVGDSCTDLALVPMAVTCTTIATAPTATGGVIADGTYALTGMQMLGQDASCSSTFNYTIRITSLGQDSYALELVLDLLELEASGTFTTNGTTMTSTLDCITDGATGTGEPATTSYSATSDLSGARLKMIESTAVYDFERVGD